MPPIAIALVVAILLITPAIGQEISTGRSTTATPDMVSQLSAVTGWTKATRPYDAVAHGTIVYRIADDSLEKPVIYKSRDDRARVEYSNDNYEIFTGWTVTSMRAGKVRVLPPHAALSMRPTVFPFFSDLAEVGSPEIQVKDLGTDTVDKSLTRKIRIVREPLARDEGSEMIRTASPITVWISLETFLPVQIEVTQVSIYNRRGVRHRTFRLSDYRKVNGVAVPFRQDEFLEDGTLFSTLQLSSVQFDTGVSDAEFAIANPRGDQ